jgi:hypothetical protein
MLLFGDIIETIRRWTGKKTSKIRYIAGIKYARDNSVNFQDRLARMLIWLVTRKVNQLL